MLLHPLIGYKYYNNYIDLEKVRAATWNGIPQTLPYMRCSCWKLLLDYYPIDTEQLDQTLERKRQEYFDIVKNYFGNFDNDSVSNLVSNLRQEVVSAYDSSNK